MLGRSTRLRIVALAPALALGCPADSHPGDDDSPRCVVAPAPSCAPLYSPTFEQVFANTLMPDCANGGGACHGTPDALGAIDGALYFDNPAASYARLVADESDAGAFVVADDPDCSSIIVRMMSTEPEQRMPPGAELDQGELCSVAQWIAQGAQP